MKHLLQFIFIMGFGHVAAQRAAIVQDADTSWWKSAVMYEITPYLFVDGAHYADLEAKIPDIANLGVNTIWLQPVFKTYAGGQGYDITDYFSLRSDLGSEAELQSFIGAAHLAGMRVLLDFPVNHTSIHHPYAQDRIKLKEASAYNDYYQSVNDHAPYSSNYHFTKDRFVYYFWKDLVNLNFSNDSVKRWMLQACTYWVKRLDIDGYRFDAAWAVNARAPGFARQLTAELRKLKPSMLLLAEDKGSTGTPYDAGFNAAYDWNSDTSWVSRWSWEYEYTDDNSKTIFNHPSVSERKKLLQQALFGAVQPQLRLRFLENNDLHRFIANHSLAVTKMAATVMFSLPGIPLIYNGQEVANKEFPYESGPIFQTNRTIASLNTPMFNFYRQLTGIRREHPVLCDAFLEEMPVRDGSGVLAWQRGDNSEQIVVVVNLDSRPVQAVVQVDSLAPLAGGDLSFTDLMSGDTVTAYRVSDNTVRIPVDGSAARLLLLNRGVIVVPQGSGGVRVAPNPTAGSFSLQYEASADETIRVTLIDRQGKMLWTRREQVQKGMSAISFSVSDQPDGLYFLKIDNAVQKRVVSIMKIR